MGLYLHRGVMVLLIVRSLRTVIVLLRWPAKVPSVLCVKVLNNSYTLTLWNGLKKKTSP